ncbi:MAG: hypothetical protein P9M06_07350 [Candidatus Saelkia tenebricola]|nr:hypothetical protein [Candidatus Saelkia tenebricola]
MQKEYVTWRNKRYRLYKDYHPHIVVSSKKELHGFWGGKRECTSERLLINPYSGCSVGCFFCYARSFPGWFQIFREQNIITVAEDFDAVVALQLDSLDVASCGYLSPVTDPFQPLNDKFHLSEKIVAKFIERNIPIEFITKSKVPNVVLEMMQSNVHNFGQVSILSLRDKFNKLVVPCGAHVKILLKNIYKMSKKGIFSVLRIDPIFPYLTDKKDELKSLIKKGRDSGVRHIVTSIVDIPVLIKGEFLSFVKKHFGIDIFEKYVSLYHERIGNYMHADIDYRLEIFNFLRQEADKAGLSFALCMEYKKVNDGNVEGLNRYFMSSVNCEGINIPLYKRKGDKFYPLYDCTGNCLNCREAFCGIDDLAMGHPDSKKDWKLRDYKRWSTMIK